MIVYYIAPPVYTWGEPCDSTMYALQTMSKTRDSAWMKLINLYGGITTSSSPNHLYNSIRWYQSRGYNVKEVWMDYWENIISEPLGKIEKTEESAA